MDWLNAHKQELDDVFAEANQIVSTFPAPLNQLGLAYLAKFDASKEGTTKNYICYLLPYWMKDACDLPAAEIQKLSLANVFIMLYYFIQDDIMDSAKGEHKDKLPLANLFHIQFSAIYRDMFPSSSPFWRYYESYVLEWSKAVSNEQISDYFHTDRNMIAKKASPVKNASTAALLLSQQAALIPAVTEAVEQVLVTLQMLDDWADWEEDIEEGSYNCLLASMRKRMQLPADSVITAEMVKDQLFVRDFLETYGQIAATHHEDFNNLQTSLPQMMSFHKSLVTNIQIVEQEIKEKRKKLASGGFYYYLSESSL
ncbi:hypothetical protein GCM10008018_05490 [Paenibacillus marchantiophytorum]|uniref:Class 1 isoprenoid biosynthesis enzyme n=1 Tax=Paenibacillus marchantiophytorum TaxID=1619310 RepID=A0ABQ2BNX8_9BACL|nr:hypothetical protein [Paenibacillus marchantiophytorum]GGI44115.1 hypothetical protein GCM10008018_05490 [Paenibacillus marchantiophytorum]